MKIKKLEIEFEESNEEKNIFEQFLTIDGNWSSAGHTPEHFRWVREIQMESMDHRYFLAAHSDRDTLLYRCKK